MIQEGRPSKKKEEATTVQIYMATELKPEAPYYLWGSDIGITFSQKDHLPAIPRPRHAPLVHEAHIGGFDKSHVFMDRRSSMNIIFSNTLRKMLISQSALKASDVAFHGVVPGEAVHPLGRIRLDVIFGNRKNFRREILKFELVNWQSQYHAILGRPTFAKFMAIPHYAYLKLIMPGPAGVITINGCFPKSDKGDRDFHQVSDTFGAQQELAEIAMVTDRSLFPVASRSELKEITREFSIDSDTTTH